MTLYNYFNRNGLCYYETFLNLIVFYDFIIVDAMITPKTRGKLNIDIILTCSTLIF